MGPLNKKNTNTRHGVTTHLWHSKKNLVHKKGEIKDELKNVNNLKQTKRTLDTDLVEQIGCDINVISRNNKVAKKNLAAVFSKEVRVQKGELPLTRCDADLPQEFPPQKFVPQKFAPQKFAPQEFANRHSTSTVLRSCSVQSLPHSLGTCDFDQPPNSTSTPAKVDIMKSDLMETMQLNPQSFFPNFSFSGNSVCTATELNGNPHSYATNNTPCPNKYLKTQLDPNDAFRRDFLPVEQTYNFCEHRVLLLSHPKHQLKVIKRTGGHDYTCAMQKFYQIDKKSSSLHAFKEDLEDYYSSGGDATYNGSQ